MSRRYEGEGFDDAADRLYAEDRQNAVDDETEARDIEAKRNAAQTSPEILSIKDAHSEGQKAGWQCVSAGLNPYTDVHSPEYAAWERGRAAGADYRFTRSKAA